MLIFNNQLKPQTRHFFARFPFKNYLTIKPLLQKNYFTIS